jgi:hypothetical protein
MMQFRISTLLLVFVAVAMSLVVFGPWGILVSVVILGGTVYAAQAKSVKGALLWMGLLLLVGLLVASCLATSSGGPSSRGFCVSHLRDIGAALLDHQAKEGSLPPARIVGKDGQPWHSWRVLILPRLGMEGLYRQYRFNEPWDGPNNSKLLARQPLYTCPLQYAGPPATSYFALLGPSSPWEQAETTATWSTNEPPRALVVEMPSNVPWMMPQDITIEEFCSQMDISSGQSTGSIHTALGRFGTQRPGFNALFSDGSVRFIRAGASPELLKAALEGDEDALNAIEEGGNWPRAGGWHVLAALAILVISVALLAIRARGARDDRIVRKLLAILQRH